MPQAFPLQNQCCAVCDDVTVQNIPGAAGDNGTDGVDGSSGVSAYTTTQATFIQPAISADVTITVEDTSWMGVNQVIFIETAGYMKVISITNTSTVIVRNLGYTGNATALATIPAGSKVCPGGLVGPSGATSGAAGGDLKGTYPNPKISLANTKGSLIAGNATDCATLISGANGTRLIADSTQAVGLRWDKVNLNLTAEVAGALAVANGGTGQITAVLGFNALSPVTTRGDLIKRGATNNDRLAIGASGAVLVSDGTDPSWAKILKTNFGTDIAAVPVDMLIYGDVTKVADGGAFVAGWTRRELDTELVDSAAIGSLLANQFTLPAGTYRYTYFTTMYRVGTCQARLFNFSDGAEVSGSLSLNGQSNATDGDNVTLSGMGRFTLAGSKALELQCRATSATPGNGLGKQHGLGGANVYSLVSLWKEAG